MGNARYLSPIPQCPVRKVRMGYPSVMTRPAQVRVAQQPVASRAPITARGPAPRFAIFTVNCLNVLAAGLLIQVVLVRFADLSHVRACAVTMIALLQLSFLMFRYAAGRERGTKFARALATFNVRQVIVVALAVAGYVWLERRGVNYLRANLAVTAVLAPVSLRPAYRWSGRLAGLRRWVARLPWPLFAVLAVEAGLSFRLTWSNTAFQDEALYLWAGHLEWSHLLDGTQIPAFATYFPGAPIVYPLAGAAADAVAGLAGARALSLIFTLIATILLWSTTSRLYGRWAAYFASGLFGVAATTQVVGAFATYDAMSLMLLAAATWIAVCASGSRVAVRVVLLVITAALVGLADAASYTTVIWDPVVVTVAILVTWRAKGGKAAAGTAVILLGAVTGLLAAAVRLGGHPYWRGVRSAFGTLVYAGSSAFDYGSTTSRWVGIIAVLAVIGAIAAVVGRRSVPENLCTCALGLTVALAPLNQVGIEAFVSHVRNADFAAWFASAAAGYALASLAAAVPRVKERRALTAGAGAVAISTVIAVPAAFASYSSWPNSTALVAHVQKILRQNEGPVLAPDTDNVFDYYLHDDVPYTNLYGQGTFQYQDPSSRRHLTGNAAYADAIENRFFSVIALSFSVSPATDQEITGDIRAYGGYTLTATLPYRVAGGHSIFQIWVRDGAF